MVAGTGQARLRKWLDRQRTLNGWRIEDCAQALGVHRNTLHCVLRGHRPGGKLMLALAREGIPARAWDTSEARP
jgi:hypothetical protein